MLTNLERNDAIVSLSIGKAPPISNCAKTISMNGTMSSRARFADPPFDRPRSSLSKSRGELF